MIANSNLLVMPLLNSLGQYHYVLNTLSICLILLMSKENTLMENFDTNMEEIFTHCGWMKLFDCGGRRSRSL